MKRTLIVLLALVVIGIFGVPALLQRLVYPQEPFDAEAVPPAPDYRDANNWAALPGRDDGADRLPGGPKLEDRQADAAFDVFYIHPTSYLLGGNWNGATDNWLARWLVQNGTLPQQAAVFNGVAKVYAPYYRQAAQGAQDQDFDLASRELALQLAYGDVQRAFDYFLDHYNRGRPFFIASHSQGTDHSVPLVNHLFDARPEAAKRLVAAYLIGNTVQEDWLPAGLPVCKAPAQLGCAISWNAVLEGGNDDHWQAKGRPFCVNPLSWRQDEVAMSAEYNLGAIHLTGPSADRAPDTKLVGARCGNGTLWITQPAAEGYSLAVREDGSYHAYEYKLFYMNLRQNIAERARAWLDLDASL